MDDLDAMWLRWRGPLAGEQGRGTFRIDPAFTADRAPGAPATLYQSLRPESPDMDQTILDLTTDLGLREAMRRGVPGAHELAFELMNLGAPVDESISDFSKARYLADHPDIREGGLNPLVHYVLSGAREQRWTLGHQRRLEKPGARPFDAARSTCLIGVHDMARTGAPSVGLDLAREAARTHNVVVVSPRGGELMPDFLDASWRVLVTEDLLRDAGRADCLRCAGMELAVLNSVECARHIPWLVAAGIPFATYVHEYEDYTYPPSKLTDVALYSDLVVFSSESQRAAWSPVLDEAGFDRGDSLILPQRRLRTGHPGAEAYRAARDRLSQVLGRDLSGTRLVCGAGRMQWRKGVDLFVDAAKATKALDPEALFVWIGDGLNPIDPAFGVWFQRQLATAGIDDPDGNIRLLPSGPDYPHLLAAADAMFLSSRLDPLPNVAFDAILNGCRVVLFDGATGFDDEAYRETGLFVPVPPDDVGAAAAALVALPRKPPDGQPAPAAPGVAIFGTIARELRRHLSARRHFAVGESPLDASRLFSGDAAAGPWRVREREKLFGYRRRAIWRDVEEAARALSGSGHPAHAATRVRHLGPTDEAPPLPFGAHIHGVETDEVASLLQGHAVFRLARRLVVTTDDSTKARGLEGLARTLDLRAEVVVVPRAESALEAFFREVRSGSEDIEAWCHIATGVPRREPFDGAKLRRAALRNLLGDAHGPSPALNVLGERGVGLVAPLSPFVGTWGASRRHRPALARRLRVTPPEDLLLFPEDNLLWSRVELARAMDELFGRGFPWATDPTLDKGAGDQALARLWPAVAAQIGLEAAFVHGWEGRDNPATPVPDRAAAALNGGRGA